MLAPLALLAVVVAIFLVVTSTLTSADGEDSPSSGTATSQTDTASTTETGGRTTTTPRKKRQPKTYTVQAGDILSTVSEQTGVSVEELQTLNPEVDPQALQVGQVLKLKPGAGSDAASETVTTP